MIAPQLTFDLGFPVVPEDPAPAPYVRPGLLGKREVEAMQAEGWTITGGLQCADCYVGHALRGGEDVPVFLADPETYPHLW